MDIALIPAKTCRASRVRFIDHCASARTQCVVSLVTEKLACATSWIFISFGSQIARWSSKNRNKTNLCGLLELGQFRCAKCRRLLPHIPITDLRKTFFNVLKSAKICASSQSAGAEQKN